MNYSASKFNNNVSQYNFSDFLVISAEFEPF